MGIERGEYCQQPADSPKSPRVRQVAARDSPQRISPRWPGCSAGSVATAAATAMAAVVAVVAVVTTAVTAE
jgi:hypothetical protein